MTPPIVATSPVRARDCRQTCKLHEKATDVRLRRGAVPRYLPLPIVTVSLHRRATTIASETKSDDLGQLNLIDGDLNTHEVFQGSLRILKNGSQEWHSSSTQPTPIDPRSLPGQTPGDEEWTFLPLSRDQGILERLSPSFEGSSYLSYAHVDY